MIDFLYITPLVHKKGNVNSEINTSFLNALRNLGIQPTVLGSSKSCPDSLPISQQLLRPVELNFLFSVIYKLSWKSLRRYFDLTPDAYRYFWYYPAKHTAIKNLQEKTYKYIHSVSVPFSSHLLAYHLKKEYGIPWVAQFFEPWSDNPYRYSETALNEKNNKWEALVAEEADIIIHNSQTMCSSWEERYGDIVRSKLFALPMPFDFPTKQDNRIAKNERIVISHIGNFYGLRNSIPFLNALEQLKFQHKDLYKKIEVRFIGSVTSEDIAFIKQNGLDEVVRCYGVLSEESCVNHYNESNIFLVIESEDQGELFFPSKIIRYYYYQKPILGITTSGSVLFEELMNNGHSAFVHSDISGIVRYLTRAIAHDPEIYGINMDAWERFSSKNVAEQYLKIVKRFD